MQQSMVYLFLLFLFSFAVSSAYGDADALENRQPLELVFADSIVPQGRHETMLTTGGWYSRHGRIHHALLTQKVEFGITDQFQISTFMELLNSTNESGSRKSGIGDLEIGARYTWPELLSPFTHLALAFEAGFPTGNARRGLGEGAYSISPSLLFSHEFEEAKYQLFFSTGIELIAKHRRVDHVPRHSLFFNGGLSRRTGPGWIVGEISVSSDEWNRGKETLAALTPSYVWRVTPRAELLVGVPIGLTSSTDRVGAVMKFTFELGGED